MNHISEVLAIIMLVLFLVFAFDPGLIGESARAVVDGYHSATMLGGQE